MKNNYKIGQKIKHGPVYGLTCSERFPGIYDDNLKQIGRLKDPTPLYLEGEGYIIGLRMAIMGEYSYTKGYNSQGFEDPYPEHVLAYSSGKREECLVCTKSIKPFNPYLVRVKDIKELI